MSPPRADGAKTAAPACNCGWMTGDASHKSYCATHLIDWSVFSNEELSSHYFHPWSHESRMAVRDELVKRGVLPPRRI